MYMALAFCCELELIQNYVDIFFCDSSVVCHVAHSIYKPYSFKGSTSLVSYSKWHCQCIAFPVQLLLCQWMFNILISSWRCWRLLPASILHNTNFSVLSSSLSIAAARKMSIRWWTVLPVRKLRLHPFPFWGFQFQLFIRTTCEVFVRNSLENWF